MIYNKFINFFIGKNNVEISQEFDSRDILKMDFNEASSFIRNKIKDKYLKDKYFEDNFNTYSRFYCGNFSIIISNNEQYIKFVKNNESHNSFGPAFFEYDIANRIESIVYMVNGKSHRINGPAIIKYSYLTNLKNDSSILGRHIILEVYMIHGKEHNSVGVSAKGFCRKKTFVKFNLNNVEISKNNFLFFLENRNKLI